MLPSRAVIIPAVANEFNFSFKNRMEKIITNITCRLVNSTELETLV
jgi:hypothetical protein